MKVLLINGSPRKNRNTSLALAEMEKIFALENIEVIKYEIGTKNIRGCIACGTCHAKGKCAFDDDVNYLVSKLHECDGVVIATPVYYASANGSLISLLDRLFYSNNKPLTMKVGASVAVLRRGGASSTFDELNKYFTISNMPIVSSQYWNSVHGRRVGEASLDYEGLQTMRTLANNMIFLMKCIKLGKEKYGLPEKEIHVSTDFIKH